MSTEVSLPDGRKHSPHIPGVESVPDLPDEVSMLDLLLVLASRKRIILAITLGFALTAVVVSLLLPQRYTATATILPPQQSSSLGASLASQLGNMSGMMALAGGGLGIKNPNDMLVAMMKSRTVEDAMVQRYRLASEYRSRRLSDARKSLENNATIDGSGKDGLIRISIEDRNPNRAAELVNGYVSQFQNLSEHLAITEASQRRLFFERQLEDAKNNLVNAEENLKKTEQQTGVIQLGSQAEALIGAAASIRAQITAKEVEIQSLETFATDQNAQLVQAQRELDSLRSQLTKLGGSEDASDALIVPKGKVPEVSLEYVRRLRDVKYYETIFDILARQLELAKLDEAKEGALIQIVDAAVPPDRRSFPKRTIIVVLSTLAGLLIAVITALFQASLQHLKKDAESRDKLKLLRDMLSFGRRKTRFAH